VNASRLLLPVLIFFYGFFIFVGAALDSLANFYLERGPVLELLLLGGLVFVGLVIIGVSVYQTRNRK
jgi:FtsH-binding integral membrane protein